jgi:hypothetical protein
MRELTDLFAGVAFRLMNFRRTPLLLISTACLIFATTVARGDDQAERIAVSYALAFGRVPTTAEITAAATTGTLSMAALLARHEEQLHRDATAARATLVKACEDALGRQPTEAEIAGQLSDHLTYTELMKRHIQSLKDRPDEYAGVMEKAYQLVVRRSAYPEEIKYWNSRDTLPYVLLLGCVEQWGRRNAPGLMVTTGIPTISVNCRYLTTITLSPEVAGEGRAAAGLVVNGDPTRAAAAGLNLVAPGSAQITTVGHMYFAAVGGPELQASAR